MRSRRGAIGCLVLIIVAALLLTSSRPPMIQDALSPVRADAAAAAAALDDGHLAPLEKQLAENRGNPYFAYYFTSRTTPRALGDALATVAGTDGDHPLKKGVDAHAYELTLIDLAGTLALATHGTGRRALPKSWSEDFIKATTTPKALHVNDDDSSDKAAKQRADQDVANKQNLLLLLSRGYWSVDFLVSVTKAYWDLDHKNDGHAWPGKRLDSAKYAPAPNGTYLTDGVLALTAALTANPAAARWAFTDFQSGTKKVEGSDDAVGRFTHYLVFEHKFPLAAEGDRKGDNIGMTATLTALSSAIDASPTDFDPDDRSGSDRPMADALVLQNLAKNTTDSGSILSKAWDYAKRLAQWVWHAVQRWGHPVLLALSFAPLPFGPIAGATNAVWYAIDGVIPVLAAARVAKVAKEGEAAAAATAKAVEAEQVAGGVAAGSRARVAAEFGKDAKDSGAIAKAANAARVSAEAEDNAAIVTAETLRYRPVLRSTTKAQVRDAAATDARGNFIDPNTGQRIPRDGPFDYGHKPGYEWRCTREKALALDWTLRQLTDYFNNPSHYQIEDPSSNRSHLHESPVCAN